MTKIRDYLLKDKEIPNIVPRLQVGQTYSLSLYMVLEPVNSNNTIPTYFQYHTLDAFFSAQHPNGSILYEGQVPIMILIDGVWNTFPSEGDE